METWEAKEKRQRYRSHGCKTRQAIPTWSTDELQVIDHNRGVLGDYSMSTRPRRGYTATRSTRELRVLGEFSAPRHDFYNYDCGITILYRQEFFLTRITYVYQLRSMLLILLILEGSSRLKMTKTCLGLYVLQYTGFRWKYA